MHHLQQHHHHQQQQTAYRNTMAFVVSAGMVSASLAASAPCAPQLSHPDYADCSKANWALRGSCTPAGAADEASPLSTSSRFIALQAIGSITPSSVDSCTQEIVHRQDQPLQQPLHQLLVSKQEQQSAMPASVTLLRQPGSRAAVQLGLALTATADSGQKQQGSVPWVWQQPVAAAHQQQQQQQSRATVPLLQQHSNNSSGLGSSCGLGNSFTDPLAWGASSGSITANSSSTAWQQLLQHQQQKLAQQQYQAQPATCHLGKRPSSSTQLPVAKKAATSIAVAQLQLLQASVKTQQQQHLVVSRQAALLQQAQLPPTGLVRHRQHHQQLKSLAQTTSAAGMGLLTAGSAPAVPLLQGLESVQQKLLQWAGRVLSCQVHEAYLLCIHMYRRVREQLDDMLLVSLGVTASADGVIMLVSLWVASKLEGHRRQVSGASKLAAALQLLPGSITDIELHVMQCLGWRPYAGYGAASVV